MPLYVSVGAFFNTQHTENMHTYLPPAYSK